MGIMRIVKFFYHHLKRFLPRFITTKITAWLWGRMETSADDSYWWNFKPIRAFIQEEITGNAALSWFSQKIMGRTSPFGRVLTFGDGYGMALEAADVRKDVAEIVYVNISKGEGIRFRKRIDELNIDIPCEFIQADANTFDFSSLGFFDTMISVGAFHHFKHFESIFPQLNKQLQPDGIVYVDEYVGPSRWDFSANVIDTINDWLMSLPDELTAARKRVSLCDYKQLYRRCGDSSEAVRSGELDRMLRRYFELIEAVPFGGTLLQPFFLTSHFKPCRLNIKNWHHTEIGQKAAGRLVRLEHELIKSGEIGKDYVYYTFKKRG